MRIGEVAERAGVTTNALRFYEDAGLLQPPERTTSGYRRYDSSVLDRLQFIRSAQGIGLTLADIKEILALRDRDEVPCDHVRMLLDEQLRRIDSQIVALRKLRAALAETRDEGRSINPSTCDPAAVCTIIRPLTPGAPSSVPR